MTAAVYTAYDNAFCDDAAAPVFKGVQGSHDIYQPDPFDVPEVHQEARKRFERLIRVHSGPDAPNMGSVLLLKGRAGSGKTHLMRAFRDRIHREATGYFGYLQLTAQTDNYHRYVMGALVDHLQQPYHVETDPRTALQRLSDALAESSPVLQCKFEDTQRTALKTLREDALSEQIIIKVVRMLAQRVLQETRFANIDIDLIRALLYLQTRTPELENKVKKYLRAEPLSAFDEKTLGGIKSLTTEEAPARLLAQLGLLMWRTEKKLLVIGVDQIEDIANMDNAQERFQRAISALTALANAVPSAIIVVACLEDYYISLRGHLLGPSLDRLEQDPEPVTLHAHPAATEVAPILAKRLAGLYARAGLERPTPDCYPFTPAITEKLAGLTIRNVLAFARQWQERCIAKGGVVPPPFDETSNTAPQEPPAKTTAPVNGLGAAWNDHRHAATINVPVASHELAPILEEGIAYCRDEREELRPLCCKRRETVIYLEGRGAPALVGLCNRSPAGGALLREIEAFQRRLKQERPVVVRAGAFPTATSKTGKLLAQIEAQGGRRVQIEDSEWRAILAMRAFREGHADDAEFQHWLKRDAPLTRLPGLRALLELDAAAQPTPYHATSDDKAPETARQLALSLGNASSTPETTQGKARKNKSTGTSPTPPPRKSPETREDKPMLLGKALSRQAEDIYMAPSELTRHAALLGGTGSGKTTLAMRLVEELLFRGVPVLLLDRKGDLCGYAAPEAASAKDNDSLRQLRARIAPTVYTPGNPKGRPLRLRLMPPRMAALDDFTRGQTAGLCAASLCRMMNYGNSEKHKARQSLLKAAFEVFAGYDPEEPGLKDIIAYLNERDPSLLALVDNLPGRVFDGLIEDLTVLNINKSHLFGGTAETLDCQRFFTPAPDGRTPMTIISTKFLGDQTDTEFWTAQLFIEVGRWIDAAPASTLQGVLFCDEADLYLPAQRQPATKQPMENLLRRARSAGIGVLLATQSPGDFDYRCRDNIHSWFIGRIHESTARNKMKPLLQQYGDAIEKKLPTMTPGQFVFATGGAPKTMAATRCLVAPEQLPTDVILDIAKSSKL